ncbi:type VI secretion system tip protein VgrG [Geobacter sulfurreducens]|uniref:Type VI secretion system needle syringe protein TssI n=1 Tax=Geobacter sulfurreducens (strain ATCC 51573 / DSM 12127 / PCA) TaxID=243231 RepID=Q747T8_GEOSL|nr:type VI secretion system Vgr family protein [Geobacter sulfurreducens]AAR36568.1 type VI secretion system needle syringe protein TssI [Geobacter sulfurreducens PCA]ADI85926.1 type VI secretion system needle syringe protein TssI [Geobacter sulfurreducens KN400]AJY69410.1 type VI secretion protein [Geobacter sulfurreducens]UAC03837.1 type VI secretion system tip protein VgrG [Geobacter sulfurreducens]HBB70592.1 type VI secretion system tip protein VgrG [Geobacter sulfurreducens]
MTIQKAAASLLSQGSTSSFQFEIPATRHLLSVAGFTVDERISHPYDIHLTLATKDNVDLDEVIDKEAVLSVDHEGGTRYFHGVVREFTSLGTDGDYDLYHAHIVPALWFLSLEQDCRVFQFKNVQDIVAEILEESNITSDRYRFALSREDRLRKFCVQYRETDLNFVSRLLEEEGIFYFFEHYEDKHVIVFSDTGSGYLYMPGKRQIPFNTNDGMVPGKESVFDFIYSRRVRPGKVSQRDYCYKHTNLDLTTQRQGKVSAQREVYDFPGNYFNEERGTYLANVRLERLLVLGATAEGQSSCPRMMPGHEWELSGHDYAGKYLPVAVIHHGAQPQVLGEHAGDGGFRYDNEFIAVPAAVTVRPQIVAGRPAIVGLQTAVVTGSPGEEIHADPDGYLRVKVQFPWDRRGRKDGRTSCWVRVGQPWGGGGWGTQFLPRVGDEVLVTFLEGDPDRPMVIGSAYNSENQPLYALPASKTQSGIRTRSYPNGGTDNFHELRFEDKKGSEEIYLQSEKDWNILVKNDKGQTVGRNESLTVGNNRSKTVGVDQSESVGVNKSIQVGANHNESIGANMTLSVGGFKNETVGINSLETIGGAKELAIGGLYQVAVGGVMNETVAGAKTEEVGLAKAVFVGNNMSENVKGDRTTNTNGNYTETISAKYYAKADEYVIEAPKITLKAGSSSIVMDGSSITIKASKIFQN